MYWRQLSEYRRYFGDEQILVQFFEDFVASEATVVGRCCRFLGIDPWSPIGMDDSASFNRSEGKEQRAAVVDLVRALPAYEHYKRVIPQAVKTYFSTHFTSPIDTDIMWAPDTLAWVADELRGDSGELLRHVGRAPSFWVLDPQA